MSSGSFRGALQQTYAEQSVFGLQMIDAELSKQITQVARERVLSSMRVNYFATAAVKHREMLGKTWKSITECANDREKCARRECTCSYADYICYRNLREAQERLTKQSRRLAREHFALQATQRYVLPSVARRILDNDEYREVFLFALHLADDITLSELETARMYGYLKVRLLPDSIELIIGQEHQVTKCIDVMHESAYDSPGR